MKKLFVANWKSNKNKEEVETWLSNFKVITNEEQQVIIAPPYPFLSVVSDFAADKEDISLSVQNLSSYPAGSYTGEVCVRNLAGYKVSYAILGHSERRRYLKESHQDVANKITLAVNNGITPIICIDEDYLEDQASAINSELLTNCVVAYEPLAAIGTGQNASVEDVSKVVAKIKDVFGEVPVLYGGSVNQENVASYLKVTDGVLVGGASLSAEDFSALFRF